MTAADRPNDTLPVSSTGAVSPLTHLPDTGQAGVWYEPALGDECMRADFAAQARRDLQIREFQHDVEWLNADLDPTSEELVVIADSEGGKIQGLVVARAASNVIAFTLGGVTLLRKRLRQFTVHQGPLTRRPATGDALTSALVALGARMGGGAAYLSSVPLGSAVHGLLEDRQSGVCRRFLVLPWGNENMHYRITWAGDVKTYLASLSTKRRANVKRSLQRLKAAQACELKRFRGADEVDAFLREAVEISAKTYQSRDLGLGLLANAGRESLIRFAAQRDALRGYVLTVSGTPVAYRYGFVYGATFFAIATGFDPAWSEHKPGAAIFLDVLYDLEKDRLPVTLIDLLPHENAFKRDRANAAVGTRNYYLFKRTAGNFAFVSAIRLLERGKRVAERLLGRSAGAGQAEDG